MNAWRCTKCHLLFSDHQVGHEGKLLICPDDKAMVCNVTSTRIGQAFLAEQQKSYVPSRVRYQYMNKRLSTFDKGRQP